MGKGVLACFITVCASLSCSTFLPHKQLLIVGLIQVPLRVTCRIAVKISSHFPKHGATSTSLTHVFPLTVGARH